MYFNRYSRAVIIDRIDVFIISLIISFSLSTLIKNQKKVKQKTFDYKLVNDLKRQCKKIKQQNNTSRKPIGYSTLEKKQRIIQIANNIRGGEFEAVAGIKIDDEIASRILCIIEKLKKSRQRKYIELSIHYLTWFFYKKFGVVWSLVGDSKEIRFGFATGTLSGLLLAELAVIAVPSIIILGTSFIIRSTYQQLTYSVPQSLSNLVCEAAVLFHNDKDRLMFDPFYQEKLNKIADSLGVPRLSGPWQCKSGRLYKRYLDRLTKTDKPTLRPEDIFDEFVRKTDLCEEIIEKLH